MRTEPPALALLAATGVHLGFQLTVTFVVYPSLRRAPDWTSAHQAHVRRITPVVAVVYGSLAGTAAWAALSDRSDRWTKVALGGVGVSALTTATVAGPAHRRLAESQDDRLLKRLWVADRVRTAGAAAGLVGAVGSLLRG